ncbi:MAG: T9SS type A sorting domain-containing protein [Crocinitomicaceae bacterium]|nr:T9SS type A sorting domain-containing protein [Crocinitomicaceae bacterium]
MGVTDGVAFTPPVGLNTYTATSTDPGDCDLVIEILVGEIPTVDAGSDVNICEGDSVLLDSDGTAETYTWSGGAPDSVWFTPSAGTTIYTLTGEIDLTGCSATDDVSVAYNVINLAVSYSGGTLTSGTSGATYQWVTCPGLDPVTGATSQDFTPVNNGDYAVIIDLNSCIDTSDCTTIADLGVESFVGNSAILAYPNPTESFVTINTGGIQYETIKVYALDGKCVLEIPTNGKEQLDIDLTELNTGIYLLEAQGEKTSQTIKITKK